MSSSSKEEEEWSVGTVQSMSTSHAVTKPPKDAPTIQSAPVDLGGTPFSPGTKSQQGGKV
jgi:hypothetical protein